MTISKTEIITSVCQISSLYQLLESKEQLGEPCLLMIHTDSSTVLGADDSEKAAVRKFLSEAPFMSAVVSESGADSELASAADMFIKAEEADEYIEKLYKDKTKKHILFMSLQVVERVYKIAQGNAGVGSLHETLADKEAAETSFAEFADRLGI